VFEISGETFPTAQILADIHQQIFAIFHENLLIFLDKRPKATKSIWYWRGGKQPREHYYFQTQHLQFIELIQGIESERERRWYASILLNSLMFIWFLQKKAFLDQGNMNYLPDKLKQCQNNFYQDFLSKLFFQGFAKPKEQRSAETNALLGEIRYLNGGLFLPHKIETQNQIQIPDQAFNNLFQLFASYSWSLNDIRGGADNEINPDVLGYIFEKYINQKQFGAYYTPKNQSCRNSRYFTCATVRYSSRIINELGCEFM